MIMSIKDKIMNMITAHPKLLMFGIGLAITFVIGAAIGNLFHTCNSSNYYFHVIVELKK